jgi:Plasmid encoded RepA protein
MGDLKHVSEILPAIAEQKSLTRVPAPTEPVLFDEVIRPEDIGYTHPVFLQCFLPTRHSARNMQRWQTDCGRASLVIRAGELANPDKPHEWELCIVPAGPKARFVVAYVNDYIQRHGTATVNMGDSLRDAMRRLDIPTGGKNGKELTREIKNFAAAEIGLGVWNDDQVHHHRALVATHMSFWLEKNPDQRTIWQPEMTVSQEYFNAVRDGGRMAPFYWPAMIALQHDTRAMDIHCFLTYRLRNGLKRPVPLRVEALHALFGQDIQQKKRFWFKFKESLEAARKQYPQAVIDVKTDCIILHNSPPLIPYRKVLRLGR